MLWASFSCFFVTIELLLSSDIVTPRGTYFLGLVESISSNLEASGRLEDELRVVSDATKESFCLSEYVGREVLRVVEMGGALLATGVAEERVFTSKLIGKVSEVLPTGEAASFFPLRGEDVGLGLFSVAKNLSALNRAASRVACSSASFLLAASVLGLPVGSFPFVAGV